MQQDPSLLTLDDEWFRLSGSATDIITLGRGCEGVVVFGQTGGAKTSSMKTAALQLLRKGLGGIVFCVKKEEYGDWLKFARQAGRLNDVVEFAPGKHCYNFINAEAENGGALIENIVSVILDAAKVLGGKQGDDTWDKAAKQLMRSLITILLSACDRVTIDDMYACIANMPKAFDEAKLKQWQQNSTLGRFLSGCKTDHPDLEASVSYLLEEWPALASETSSSVQFTLSSTIDTLRRAPLKDWLCDRTTVRPEDARTGKIIIVNYPIMQYKEAARLAQIIYKSSAQRALERTGGNFVFIWNDEEQYTFAPGDIEFATTRRSNRIIDVILLQNLPLLFEKAGNDSNATNRAKAYIGNMVTKIFFLNDCDVTNEYAANLLGKSLQMRKNVGKSSNVGGGKYSSGQNAGESEQRDYLVQPQEFGELMSGGKDFNFYTEGYVRQSRKHTWSNGNNRYFKAVFDQKIGQRASSTLTRRLMLALAVVFVVYAVQDIGLLPEAGTWLPSRQFRGNLTNAALRLMRAYSYYLFPTVAGIVLFCWLTSTRKNTAR
ncbi:MAG: type IV secretory system conjugative DNA transfer family protein [Verrucomicrobiales bacterium]|jgi:type IV secretory pathway TraG/TraD family ATPase VirD4|nr:type IV secretory system conjugative DNA transfer family protein [Verrucomicrobiales bacterium]